MTVSLFWIATALIVYSYAGYPVFIYLLGRLRHRPLVRSGYTPPITVVIAARNEAAQIRQRLDNLLAQNYPPENLQIIVASDGSDDETAEVIRAYRDDRISVLEFHENRGKAACLNDAVAACTTDYVVFADARQRFDDNAIRELMTNFADPALGAVSGELIIESDAEGGFSQGVDVYWKYEKFIRQAEANFASVIGVTGAIYALRRSCFRPIPPGLILDDVLIPMQSVRDGMRVGFDSHALAYDIPPPSPEWEQRRKIRTLAGNFQLIRQAPWLLSPFHNPVWLQFVSHKLLRLLVPYLLAAALITNALLAPIAPLYLALLICQLVFYVAAIIGAVAPATQKFLPFRIAMTFCLLNWSAVLGLREFLARRSTQLW